MNLSIKLFFALVLLSGWVVNAQETNMVQVPMAPRVIVGNDKVVAPASKRGQIEGKAAGV